MQATVETMKTISDVLAAFRYYIDNGGYYEKANGNEKYLGREVEDFAANKGSANYTYMGKLCGVNPGAWCAMMVSTAVHDGCGFSKEEARKAMWGLWPYTTVRQLWNAADDSHRFYGYYQRWTLGKGDRVNYIPEAGDVIIFTDNGGGSLTHTGMVYAVDDSYVYTYEGNSGNMARKRSYDLKSSYIYGYVKLNLPKGTPTDEAPANYGAAVKVELHTLSKGCAGVEVERWQALLNGLGITDDSGSPLTVDGDFGTRTKQATIRFQKRLFPDDGAYWDGIVGPKTWEAAFFRRLEG